MRRALEANTMRAQTSVSDNTSFEELYAAYLPKVYNYVCYRIGRISIAEDLTAEIFERAFTRLYTYRSNQGAFSTWIFTIAHNLVSNHLRAMRRQREVASLDALSMYVANEVSLEQVAEDAEQLHRIQKHMSDLPELQQDVLALKFGSNLSNQEIAATLRLNPNHVGVLLHRGVHALRLALEEDEVIE